MDAAIAAWRLCPQADVEWLEPEEQLKALRQEWATRTADKAVGSTPGDELVDLADLYHYALDGGKSELELAKMTFEKLRATAASIGAKAGRGTEKNLKAMSADELVTTLCYPDLVAVAAHHRSALTEMKKVQADGITVKAKADATVKFNAAFDEYSQSLQKASDSVELKRDEKYDAKGAQDGVNKLEFQAKQAAEELGRSKRDVASAKANSADGEAVRGGPVLAYSKYLLERCGVLAELEVQTSRLQELCQVVGTKPTQQDLAAAEGWDGDGARLAAGVSDLAAQWASLAAAGGGGARLLDGDAAAVGVERLETLAERREEFKEAALRIAAEDAGRAAALAEKAKGFEQERSQLLLWCRQQKANIDALTESDAVQDLCRALSENYAMMEENFAVLLDLAEDGLLPDQRVQQALLEVNDVWLNLLISAYERLRFTLIEIHPTSSLENEVRAFAPYATRAAEFLSQFLELLSAPTDAESQQVVGPVVEEAAALKEEITARHAQLSAAMAQFSTTMDALRENDTVLRKAVFQRVTFLAGALPSEESIAHRRDDFQQKTTQLVEWAKVKSQGVSWSEVRERIAKIQGVLAEERAAIEREDQETAAADEPKGADEPESDNKGTSNKEEEEY